MEKEFLMKLKEKIMRLINKEAEKYGFDLAYFEFKVTCYILNENFDRVDKIILLDTEQKNYCHFCGKKTRFYDHKLNLYLCPNCFKEILNRKEE